MVRAAVLKMKDPTQILEELQKIDEMGTYVYMKLLACISTLIYQGF